MSVGIDFGTTYCCVSVFKNDVADIIINAQGKKLTPSYVNIGDEILVGDDAKNKNDSIYDVKRLVGKTYQECSDIIKTLNYEVSDDMKIKGYGVEEISSFILRELKKSAESYLGEVVNKAVITVPAYFNNTQRQAIIRSAELAGITVQRIINEPTAAALAYGLHLKSNHNVLVYDLGGGTFDVSILNINDGVFTVLAVNGDTMLGGEDFDCILVDYFADIFHKKNKIQLPRKSLQKLHIECEKIKCILTQQLDAELYIDSLYQGIDFHARITRSKFESLCDHLFIKTLIPIEKALHDAKIKKENISEVIMIGGSTRIPKIIDTVSNYFGKKVFNSINPDEAVAYGAAVQAAILNGEETFNEILLIDVTPLSIGIELSDGTMNFIVPRNTKIPVTKKHVFTTHSHVQKIMKFDIYQGERFFAKDNHLIGTIILSTPGTNPQIEVTLQINVNGLLCVSAGGEILVINNNITKEKISKCLEDIENNYERDQTMLRIINKRKRAEIMIDNMPFCEELIDFKKQIYVDDEQLIDQILEKIENKSI